MTEEIHDMSRVDFFMASRRRAMFFHSVWKPMLAGAVGAAIMSAAVIGSVWAILPKISTREVVVDHVIQHDVPFDNHTPQDKPFDNYVPHDKPFDLPVPAPKPVASAPPATPAERKFVARPEYESAQYKGRLVPDPDGYIRFDDGKVFYPGKRDQMGRDLEEPDPDSMYDTTPYLGDLAFCNAIPNSPTHRFKCLAIHDDVIVDLATTHMRKPSAANHASEASPAAGRTLAATNMISVDVDVAGYPVKAMVDTGCSSPMSIPRLLADTLVRMGLASVTSPAKSTLADGSTQDVDVIVINKITVDGRVLTNVVATVSAGDTAPTLLGLGALNRLGPYSIEEGRLVFTGEQPA